MKRKKMGKSRGQYKRALSPDPCVYNPSNLLGTPRNRNPKGVKKSPKKVMKVDIFVISCRLKLQPPL